MSFERHAAVALDYQLTGYPGSVLRFRGPAGDPTEPHILCLGGTETFGRFVADPFPARLAARLKTPVINMGVAGAGLDVTTGDPAIRKARRAASAIVLQVPGAQNMSNRFYTVHPRRNDRFVKASGILRTIYRDVDFTEFHFTRHMLAHLQALSEERFAVLRDELQLAWRARMRRFLAEAEAPVHLLWLAGCGADAPSEAGGLGPDPLFVTRDMLEEIAADAASLNLVETPAPTGRDATRGMFFAPDERAAAAVLPGPDAHETAATALLAALTRA